MKFEFIDPVCVPDVFATELVCVQNLGGVFRFTFAASQNGELIVVARVALLAAAVMPARRLVTSVVEKAPITDCLGLAVHH